MLEGECLKCGKLYWHGNNSRRVAKPEMFRLVQHGRLARKFGSWLVRHAYIAAETLECAPSESTNCASILPYSCLVGGMLNLTPFALIS